MLDGLIAGAISALVGTAIGFRLKATEPELAGSLRTLESHIALLKTASHGYAGRDELKVAIKEASSECHTRAANIANKASAEVMEQMLLQLQSTIAACKQEFRAELKTALDQFDDAMRQGMAEDIKAATGTLNQELRDYVLVEVADATAPLISRDEVQRAFAQVAQIEAARIAEQQEAASRAAAQQARIQEVFGVTRPLVGTLDQQLGELNAQLDQQLGALNQRLSMIRGARPAAPESELVDPGVG